MLTFLFPVVAALLPALLPTTAQGLATVDTYQGSPITTYVDCPLQRIETQLVRCDNLTGGEVRAPYWIPEQK